MRIIKYEGFAIFFLKVRFKCSLTAGDSEKITQCEEDALSFVVKVWRVTVSA